MPQGPLAGIRVIDWTIWQQGPICSLILGDLGAEVIKVESPAGDPGRTLSSMSRVPTMLHGDVNAYFEANNRSKLGITLDLKQPQGKAIMHRLVGISDVFVQNYRKGVAERLGLDYETVKMLNPGLIYAWGNGFGPEGPDAERPAFDMIAQGRSGLMYATGSTDGVPRGVDGGLSDQMGGTLLALGVLAALFVRKEHGVGQKIESSLLGGMLWLQGLGLSAGLLTGLWRPPTDRRTAANPMYNNYLCKDGRWLELMNLQQDRYWPAFCRIVGLPELTANPRYATAASRAEHAAELVATFDRIFLTRSYAEWEQALLQEDMVFGPIQRLSDVPQDPQVIANAYLASLEHPVLGPIQLPNHPVRYTETPAVVHRAAPALGQHTEEVLMQRLGYTWDELGALRAAGVIF